MALVMAEVTTTNHCGQNTGKSKRGKACRFSMLTQEEGEPGSPPPSSCPVGGPASLAGGEWHVAGSPVLVGDRPTSPRSV